MTDDAAHVDLFDDEDVDVGEEAPDDDNLTTDELAAIRTSQADPTTPPPDAEVS